MAQRTSFKYEIIVHDDASTDGTTEIIKEYENKYPDIIKPIYETENQMSKHDGSLERIVFPYLTRKYIANCDADDYWCDIHHLQDKIDFLEANPDFGMCCSKARIYNQEKKEFIGESGNADVEDYAKLISNRTDIMSGTIVYRGLALSRIQELISAYPFSDSLWAYFMAYYSNIKFFDKCTQVYRIMANSSCHSTNLETSLIYEARYSKIKLKFLIEHPIQEESIQAPKVSEALCKELDDIVAYAQTIGESKVRASKSYKIGKLITNILTLKCLTKSKL